MAPKLLNRRLGRLLFSAGLRRDGEWSWSIAGDRHHGGTVVLAIITPWVILVVFDHKLLIEYADFLEEEERAAA